MIARLFSHSRTESLLSSGVELRRIRLCCTMFSCFSPHPHRRTSLEHSFIYSHLVSAPISRSILNSHPCRFIIWNTYSFRIGSVCLKQLRSSVLRSLPVDTLCVM